ncbi:MAG: hypothetical protein ABI083_10400 [Lapillicoccus sp.]
MAGILLALTACTSSPTPSATGSASTSTSRSPSTAPGGGCAASARERVTDKGVPTCGVLWGLATQPPTIAGVEGVEKQVGRQFDLVYRYHDLVDTIPDAEEKAVVARGSLLHVAIASREFGGGDVSYADVAAGKYDASLTKQAQGVASLGAPVYVTFEQEANQKDKVGARGTAAEFIAAWRHVHDLYGQQKVSNAVWVWVMTGNEANLPRTAALWPGNAYVDWISWNIYNQSGCRNRAIDVAKYVSFEDGVKSFYDWVKASGPAAGIDPGKPMMISETGTAQYPDAPATSAQWYADIPVALKAYPQVKAVTLWASGGGGSEGGTCDYRFQNNPAVAQGVAAAGKVLAGTTPAG